VKTFERKAVWLVALLGLAAGALAQESSIRLPPDNPVAQVKAGAGDQTVRSNCSLCHSTDYIVRQPHLDAQHWDAEVKKMINTFGAPINDADEKIIAGYLAKNYGPETGSDKPAADKPAADKP
jgi:sulfite dehydrogenase (cytochrome) subunit B